MLVLAVAPPQVAQRAAPALRSETVPVSVEDGDIHALERRIERSFQAAQANEAGARWRDEGVWLLLPLALLGLLWFRRGTTVQWIILLLLLAPEGAVVIADAQTAGRGRHGRTWVSPPAAGLYLSTVLEPPGTMLSLVTIAAGVAAADGIEAATGLSPSLKWPNDIQVGSRKLGGLLAERAGEDGVILGVGINVLPAAYPADVAKSAGISRQTIYNEFGSRQGLAQAYALRLADRLVDQIDDAIGNNVGDVYAAFLQGFRDFFTESAADPLVVSLLTGELKPDLLQLITTDSGPIIRHCSQRLTSTFMQSWITCSDADASILARVIVRLAMSRIRPVPMLIVFQNSDSNS